ncbi:hypothetical protein OG884_27280 [Streptosporangium sp. NBC_01755]|uniref:hypothetical protein n=1 Tax=unclassified Streptosporangium TaxID=2632669 RepID=UPI002DD7CB40|nr:MULTISPECIES: hypothetical protein [unclassified Streptosporangium]WSA23320.1 hypothetical protein OIE13_20330 [Streptosporangium sp. NBC_01810]WSC98543.1 hypothetical protein OG884_27280 [Streptosporangium sp. NBC_01755]
MGSFRVRRGEKGPARVLRPRGAALEAPPAAQTARDYLNRRGDFAEWMTIAREKLGGDAVRDEVVVLAAELARACDGKGHFVRWGARFLGHKD